MKYLKLYEASVKGTTFKNWVDQRYGKGYDEFDSILQLNCNEIFLKDLDGIENFINLEKLFCFGNSITTLEGIEILKNLNELNCSYNLLENLKGLENTKIKKLRCQHNNLTSLYGIENLDILRLACQYNQLKDINIVRNFKNLTYLLTNPNPWQYPIPIDIFKKYELAYEDYKISQFREYKFQKEFLEEYPEKVKDLIPVGFNDQIKEEYSDLLKIFGIE